MRVAFASPFTTHHGARPPRIRSRRTARLLAARGHDVTVLCARWWDGDAETFAADGVDYRAVCDGPSPTRFAARVPGALRALDPDVIQTAAAPHRAALAATLTGRATRTPVVVDWWDDGPADTGLGARAVARAADAVVTPSRTVETAVRELGRSERAVRVVPESVDVEAIREAPVDDRFDVVYSRRLDRHANVETLLLGLAERRDADWSAAIVGDGPDRRAVERTVAELRIDDRVTFLGDRPIEERLPVFKGAQAFVQTARRETFATDLLWALACGCIGLVEYQAGSSAHELVEGRDRANLVTSPEELAEELAAAGEAERRTVEPEFEAYGHDAVLERYLDCYRELLGD